MGENRDMHVGMIVRTVSDMLMENQEVPETPGLTVGTWVSDKDKMFHITIGRVNNRTGYEKRIAIPFELVPAIAAQMLGHLVDLSERVEALQRGGA